MKTLIAGGKLLLEFAKLVVDEADAQVSEVEDKPSWAPRCTTTRSSRACRRLRASRRLCSPRAVRGTATAASRARSRAAENGCRRRGSAPPCHESRDSTTAATLGTDRSRDSLGRAFASTLRRQEPSARNVSFKARNAATCHGSEEAARHQIGRPRQSECQENRRDEHRLMTSDGMFGLRGLDGSSGGRTVMYWYLNEARATSSSICADSIRRRSSPCRRADRWPRELRARGDGELRIVLRRQLGNRGHRSGLWGSTRRGAASPATTSEGGHAQQRQWPPAIVPGSVTAVGRQAEKGSGESSARRDAISPDGCLS